MANRKTEKPRTLNMSVTLAPDERALISKAAKEFLLSDSSYARLILLEAATKRMRPKAQ